MKKIEEAKQQKEESVRRRFDNFVLKYFGEKFEDLGAFVQKEAVRMYKDITEPKPNPVPFYNWLEA